MYLFETPVKTKQVRKYVTAFKLRNGTVEIDGYTYIGYSMSEAISKFRKDHPERRRKN